MDWENLFDVDELTDQLANMQDAGDGGRENLELNTTSNFPIDMVLMFKRLINQTTMPTVFDLLSVSGSIFEFGRMSLIGRETLKGDMWQHELLGSSISSKRKNVFLPSSLGHVKLFAKKTMQRRDKGYRSSLPISIAALTGSERRCGSIDDHEDEEGIIIIFSFRTPTTTESSQPMVNQKLWVKKDQRETPLHSMVDTFKVGRYLRYIR